MLELLAVSFETADTPAGKVTLVFAGGGAVQLDVEVIEARLADLGAAWATAAKPEHDLRRRGRTGKLTPASRQNLETPT